jgi:hypothetical protein
MGKLISDSRSLILFLIKADLRANKLLTSMQEAGFTSAYYYTDLNVAIFELMDINEKDREDVATLYVQYVDEFCKLEVAEFYSRQNEIANMVYHELIKLK